MRLLFVGGTGIISSACVRRALTRGDEVTVLNRGRSAARPLPDDVSTLQADVHDPSAAKNVLGRREFDAVVQFVGFTAEHVRADLDLFAGRTGQYVFISSASAYRTPPRTALTTEDTPLDNPLWQYSRDKIAAENAVWSGGAEHDLPVTVVRPSHTYDRTSMPLLGGWTVMDRMRRGAPVIVHGDGTTLWTITHADDVAVGLVGLLGLPAAHGRAFHITNSAPLTWDAITRSLAAAAGYDEPDLRHVASESIAAARPEWTEHLLGDLAVSRVFDNSRISAAVPDFDPVIDFDTGARQIVEWHAADPDRRPVDPDVDALMDRLVAAHDRFAA